MVEEENSSPINPISKNMSPKCDECKLNPSKYKCPGCCVRSCSLTCVNAHKQRTSCTGKRKLTEIVPISQFDDNLLISDYKMLEDVKRVAESAERMRLKLCGYSHFNLPYDLKSLRSAAYSRRTQLIFLSSGMSKREANQSFYNRREKTISWTIEWRFHSTDVILTDHGVLDNTNLSSAIQKHLKPGPWNHPLKQFCMEPLESLKFFICKYPKGRRSPYRELDVWAPLSEQLANLVIIEYPVIHVYLPSHTYNFEVVKDVTRPKMVPKEPVNNREPSPEGVSFREEEIVDDNSSETQVLDLMQHVKPDGLLEDDQTGENNEETNDKNDVFVTNEIMEPPGGDLEGMDFEFDFEQGLLDAYNTLMSQTNPDGFLDLESDKESELEEGEIPEF